jgi:hypothetical protein
MLFVLIHRPDGGLGRKEHQQCYRGRCFVMLLTCEVASRGGADLVRASGADQRNYNMLCLFPPTAKLKTQNTPLKIIIK